MGARKRGWMPYGLMEPKPIQSSGPRTRLPLFRLDTLAEKNALRTLRSRWVNQRGFQRLVLAHLHLISQSISIASDKKLTQLKRAGPSQVSRDLERRASTVRSFAAKMEQPITEILRGSLIEPSRTALMREALKYAEALEDAAKLLRSLTDTSTYSLAVTPFRIHNRPPRKKARPETRLVRELIDYVRRATGQSHWNALAVLLRRPCNDLGVNEDRLRSLWKDRPRKKVPRFVSPSRHRHAHFPKPETPFTPAI